MGSGRTANRYRMNYSRSIRRGVSDHSLDTQEFHVPARAAWVKKAPIRPSVRADVHYLQLIGFVLERLRFPYRIVHQRRDFDHVTVRYLPHAATRAAFCRPRWRNRQP